MKIGGACKWVDTEGKDKNLGALAIAKHLGKIDKRFHWRMYEC